MVTRERNVFIGDIASTISRCKDFAPYFTVFFKNGDLMGFTR